jgi:hypothetical protein
VSHQTGFRVRLKGSHDLEFQLIHEDLQEGLVLTLWNCQLSPRMMELTYSSQRKLPDLLKGLVAHMSLFYSEVSTENLCKAWCSGRRVSQLPHGTGSGLASCGEHRSQLPLPSWREQKSTHDICNPFDPCFL